MVSNLSTFCIKLGHELEEIRVRALQSLLLKLQHGLIDDKILEHQDLLICLLHWFNFPSAPMKDEVLNLILRLSKKEYAATMLQNIGAVDFFTKLRKDCDHELQILIDNILDNLFLLPKDITNVHTECHDKILDIESPLPSQFLYPSPKKQNAESMKHFEHCPFTSATLIADHSKFQGNSFSFILFPWLSLTSTDRNVLVSTEGSLKSNDISLVISSCEFLTDVLFQDFPADVFLQRPAIVQSLLSLLNVSLAENQEIFPYLIKCLLTLLEGLLSRIIFHQHPTFFQPKPENGVSKASSQSLSSSDSRLSVVGQRDNRQRGDGQDNDSSSSGIVSPGDDSRPDGDLMDEEDTLALQLLQMTIPQFCVKVLNHILIILKTAYLKLSSLGFLLLHKTLSLLTLSVDQTVWSDQNAPAAEVSEKLLDCLEILGELLLLHHHSNYSPDTPQDVLIQHRLIFAGISVFTVRLLKNLIPVEQTEAILPSNLVIGLSFIVMDECLAITYPYIREVIIKYLELVDKKSVQVLNVIQCISEAMVSACLFQRNKQIQSTNYKELLFLADASLPSLAYHQLEMFLEDYIKLCSNIWILARGEAEVLFQSQQFLLKLITYPDQNIKQNVLKICSNILKESLDISKNTGVENKAHLMANFLINESVLTEICFEGLEGDNKELAKGILLRLLQGRFLMSEHMWIKFLRCLEKIAPLIMSFTNTENPLGNCVLGLVEPDARDNSQTLSEIERFKGCLRLLFSSSKRIRSEAVSRLILFLNNEENSYQKLPNTTELNVLGMIDLFVIEPQYILESQEELCSPSQEDSLVNVFNVFTSVDLESHLKKKSIDQLAQLLEDFRLHSSFIKANGIEELMAVIKKAFLKNLELESNIQELVAPTLAGLRHVLHWNHDIQTQLQHDRQFFYLLLRAALLFYNDESVRYNVAHILTLFLFKLPSTPQNSNKANNDFSLPKSIQKRFKIPFKMCNQEPAASPSDFQLNESLLCGVSGEFLRFSWNIAWHDGIEPLIAFIGKMPKQQTDAGFCDKLILTNVDKILLLCTPIKISIQQVLHDISNATSYRVIQFHLHQLIAILIMGDSFITLPVFLSLDWKSLFSRLLSRIPVCTADEDLLREVCLLLILLFSFVKQPLEDLISWLWNFLSQSRGPFMTIIDRLNSGMDLQSNISIGDNNSKSKLYKDLLTLACCIIRHHPSSVEWNNYNGPSLLQSGEFSYHLVKNLNLADSPHFYNLASLECTLACLMHITARPGWSQGCADSNSMDLCKQLLKALLEIIAAFHIGRGGTALSYMGRGVTRNATLCLRHLAHEMMILSKPETWIENWLLKKNLGGASAEDVNLTWLISLWAYRDPEVRAAGLGIAVALTTEESGHILITTHCQHITGGIWGASFSFLLDQTETSIIREQAALILVNLTSQSMTDGDAELGNVWNGPLVRDTETNISLVGLPALLVLLQHCQFYSEVKTMLTSYYPNLGISPQDIVADRPATSSSSSPATLTTLDIASAIDVKPQAEQSGFLSHLQGLQQPAYTSTPSAFPGMVNEEVRTQGLSNTPTFSSHLGDSNHIGPYSSITTPSLVMAICKLLKNLILLAPEETIVNLKEENILKILVIILSDESFSLLTEDCQTNQLEVRNLLYMYTSLLQLIAVYVRHDKTIKWQIPPLDSQVLLHCFKFFRLPPQVYLEFAYYDLWTTVFELGEIILDLCGKECIVGLSLALQQHWDYFIFVFTTALEKKTASKLCKTSLNFLIQFVSGDDLDGCINNLLSLPYNDLQLNHYSSMSSESVSPKINGANILTHLLIRLISIDSSSVLELQIFTVLRLILGISQSAKQTALQDNLLPYLLDYIKKTHANLNVVSLGIKKCTFSGHKKEQPYFDALVNVFGLLQNFMYNSLEIKEAAVNHGVAEFVHKLWSWCLLERTLLLSALTLLCTFTAKCPAACISLACTSTTVSGVKSLSCNSLVHCVIKLANREMEKQSNSEIDEASLKVVTLIFNLLSTLVMTQEGRGILWKSHFLDSFSALQPQKTKNKFKQTLELLWLKLLASLSFSPDGQQYILKIKDSTELLLGFGRSIYIAEQEAALLVIRNLCFHSTIKPKLLSHDILVPLLIDHIVNGEIPMKKCALSALWALIANNQKAKMNVKNADIVHCLQEVYSSMANSKDPRAIDCLSSLETL